MWDRASSVDALEILRFLLQLLIPALVLARHVQRRDGFWVRALLGLALSWAACYLTNAGVSLFADITLPGLVLARYLFAFGCVVLTCWLSLDSGVGTALFFSCSGYALQNVAHYVYVVLLVSVGVPLDSALLELLAFISTYALAFWLLRNSTGSHVEALAARKVFEASILTLLFTVVLSSFVPLDGGVDPLYCAYSIGAGVLILYLQYGLLDEAEILVERNVAQRELALEAQRHRMAMESVSLIDKKCHDLKHLVFLLSQHGVEDDSVKQACDAIDAYDSLPQTDNPSIDLVLAEKTLVCSGQAIDFNCMVDGSAFSFVRSGDVWTLFGCALDLAIQEMASIDLGEKWLRVRGTAQGTSASLHVTWPASQASVVGGGSLLPKVAFIADAYGGVCTLETSGGCRQLDVLLLS